MEYMFRNTYYNCSINNWKISDINKLHGILDIFGIKNYNNESKHKDLLNLSKDSYHVHKKKRIY